MLTFSQFKQHQDDNEEFRVTEGASNFNSNQLRHYSKQLQRKIQQTANDIERTPDADTNSQLARLAKMLVKLTALIGLSLAQDTGDRRMLVTSLLQEDK